MSGVTGTEFWDGKRVLVTGHTGFKGAWLTTWLRAAGARVHGVSLPTPAGRSFLGDLVTPAGLTETRADVASDAWHDEARRFSPDFVFHLAAQALVSVGHSEPAATFRHNVQGTVQVMNLLDSLPRLKGALVITTDKVYDTRQGPPYREVDYLGGSDPYSASKAAAELVVHSWPTVGAPVATARAGNVIGGGDWSPGRLVPDLIKAWTAGDPLLVRRPTATRPWQHVLEPLAGYLAYAESLATGRQVPLALNFGPGDGGSAPVAELVDHAASVWSTLRGGSPTWRALPSAPLIETERLTLDTSSVRTSLDVDERWDWRTAVSRTLEWHFGYVDGAQAEQLILSQVRSYLGAGGPASER